MKSTYFATLLIFFTLLFSCQNPEIEVEESRIDSLLNELSAVNQRIVGVDTAELFNRLESQIEKLNHLQKAADSLTKSEALIIDEFASLKKSYNKWAGKIPIFFEEIELRTNQLNDLKNDAQKGAFEVEELRTNIHNEEGYITALNDISIQMEMGLQSIDSLYLSSNSKIDSLIQLFNKE